jgi:hypothetical protein
MESDKVYRVEYAFEAEDSAELSVAQGELVVTLARGEIDQRTQPQTRPTALMCAPAFRSD